ncbi:helix-turn-helix domain-containing protein [Arthrobacter sp. MYb213]|uniref:Crp/Fnr family transcriptional regulator n=1 Tax=Arthrobacter sp. MYb213 TaxID=1848595 RepID=UPI000CFBC51F|nr:helix-turn-helix domain-containing protein [Arthrobacter sp. MYb213]PRB72751.1 hypothetical protein CQ011_03725 [Arthrobacter sp. MYb213]
MPGSGTPRSHPRGWFAATEYSHQAGHAFTLSNALMLAGAIVELVPQMDRLAEVVQRHASIGLRMLQDVSRRLGETESRLATIFSADGSSRLADYLPSLPAVTTTQHVLGVVLPLAKKDIASQLDTIRESISRQLRSLSEARVIVQGRENRITLLDIDALSELSSAL